MLINMDLLLSRVIITHIDYFDNYSVCKIRSAKSDPERPLLIQCNFGTWLHIVFLITYVFVDCVRYIIIYDFSSIYNYPLA